MPVHDFPGGVTTTVNIYATNNAGNIGSASFTVTVQQGALAISNAFPDVLAVTTDPCPTISADIADTGGTINWNSLAVTLDGTAVTAGPNGDETGFTYTPGANLTEGQHNVEVSISDDNNNNASVQWGFTVDSQAPSISCLSPANGSTAHGPDTITGSPMVWARFSDDGTGVDPSSVQLLVDNSLLPNIEATGQWAYAFAGFVSAGVHHVTVSLSDYAGHSVSQTNSFTVQALPSPLVVIEPTYAALPVTWMAKVYVVCGSDLPAVDVTTSCNLTWTGGPVSGFGASYFIPASAALGDYTVTATATNIPNNITGGLYTVPGGSASASISLRLMPGFEPEDPPKAEGETPPTPKANGGTPELKGEPAPKKNFAAARGFEFHYDITGFNQEDEYWQDVQMEIVLSYSTTPLYRKTAHLIDVIIQHQKAPFPDVHWAYLDSVYKEAQRHGLSATNFEVTWKGTFCRLAQRSGLPAPITGLSQYQSSSDQIYDVANKKWVTPPIREVKLKDFPGGPNGGKIPEGAAEGITTQHSCKGTFVSVEGTVRVKFTKGDEPQEDPYK